MLKAQVLATLGLALALSVAVSVQPQDFDIDWRTIDAGGLMFSSGGDYELSGTIGQPDAGILSGGEFTLAGGAPCARFVRRRFQRAEDDAHEAG